jgi:hypothetical protein
MLARLVPRLAAFLQVHSQASLQMAPQKPRSIRFANDQHWPKKAKETLNHGIRIGFQEIRSTDRLTLWEFLRK